MAADAPDTKWLTDLTEFHILADKVYLSPIKNCLMGWWSIGLLGGNPDAELVNTMLDDAICNLGAEKASLGNS